MGNHDSPLYRSPPSFKSLGNEYLLYHDRIELKCRFPFVSKTFVLTADELVSIGVFKPPVLRTSLRALKLDLADLFEHAGITRRHGLFRQLRFTPDDPQAFVAKVREVFAKAE